MSIKKFFQEIEKGLSSPIYFLHSDDPYLLEEAAHAVKNIVPEAEIDFNLNAFDLDSPDATPSPEDITGALNTVSFFGSRRYVVVKNFQKLSAKDFKKFQTYLANPSPAAALIILYTGKIKKELKESIRGIKTFCLDIREHDLPLWIKEKVKQKGLAIEENAVEYLIGTVGADIGMLSSEIEKLALLGNKTISLDSIREIVEGSREYSVFDLTNALKEKNTQKVFEIYKVLSETFEPYNMLGAINWQYSMSMQMLWQSGSGRGTQTGNDYYRKVFELLNDADIKIKTSGGAYPMEHLLVRLLQL